MDTEQATEAVANAPLTDVDTKELINELMRRSTNAQFIGEIDGKFYAQMFGQAEFVLGMMKIHENLIIESYTNRLQINAKEVAV